MSQNGAGAKQSETSTDWLDAEIGAMYRPLLGGMAHHFNNMLSGMLGWVTLAPTLPPETVASLGEKVKEQIEHAARLTRFVLSITRRAGEPVGVAACDVTMWARDTVAVVRTTAPHGVVLALDSGADKSLWASVSPVDFARLLLHLMLLAVEEAGERSTDRLEIALTRAGDRSVVELRGVFLSAMATANDPEANQTRSQRSWRAALRLAAQCEATLSSERTIEGVGVWRLLFKSAPER